VKGLVNAVSARIGGAANYIRMIAPELAAQAPEDTFIFLLPPEQAEVMPTLSSSIQMRVVRLGTASFLRRLWFDQVTVPRLIRREGVDVLFSSANTGTFVCPCRQVLLARNALFFSAEYFRWIFPHKGFAVRSNERLRRLLVIVSARLADLVIAPSQAMLDQLQRAVQLAPGRAAVIPYGVAADRFAKIDERARSDSRGHFCRLLYSSLYSEHKNLGTLLRALELLNEGEIGFVLRTPADPSWEPRMTSIRKRDAEVAAGLRQRGLLHFTGVMSPADTPSLYSDADVFVYPSLVESFGHPLLEAMAAGLPVVAADTPVNQELCGDAALYFSALDATECAARIATVWGDPTLRERLVKRGKQRVQRFTWRQHVAGLVAAFRGELERRK
jgi:glycosyltransferase involved in cell wall biosynthesis